MWTSLKILRMVFTATLHYMYLHMLFIQQHVVYNTLVQTHCLLQQGGHIFTIISIIGLECVQRATTTCTCTIVHVRRSSLHILRHLLSKCSMVHFEHFKDVIFKYLVSKVLLNTIYLFTRVSKGHA